MTIPLPHLFVAAIIGGFSIGIGSDCKVEPCAPSIISPEANGTFTVPCLSSDFFKNREPKLTIDPRGVIWYKGKRADQLTDKELMEVVELLLEIMRKP